MKKSIAVIVIVFTIYGCELIDISKKNRISHINLTQTTPIGAVYLFMAELDSNNAKGASVILAKNNGEMLLAEDRYEQYEEMQRLNRILKFNPITFIKLDTLSADKLNIKMEVDYYKHYSFITERINNNWYITNYNTSN